MRAGEAAPAPPDECRRCDCGGYVVSGRTPLPEDHSDHYDRRAGGVLGCNRLWCGACGDWVRIVPGVFATREVLERDPASLFVRPVWSGIEGVSPDLSSRVYVCRCHGWWEATYIPTADPDWEWGDREFEPPWRCAGHPLPGLPLRVDGHPVGRDTDLEELVDRVAGGWAPADAHSEFRDSPRSWLCRLYIRLKGLPEAERVFAAVARLRHARDEGRRKAAEVFFGRFGPGG